MTARIDEIAPDLYRICLYVPAFDLQFNQETYQRSPVLMDYVPYTENTKRQLANLAALRPRMLAAMHGSTFVGDGVAALVASGEGDPAGDRWVGGDGLTAAARGPIDRTRLKGAAQDGSRLDRCEASRSGQKLAAPGIL
jgi:hypothetical protein